MGESLGAQLGAPALTKGMLAMLAIASLLLSAVRFVLRWTFALIAALLVPPLSLLVRPWMRRRKLTREDAIVAVVGMAERSCGWLWRYTAALLGPFVKRRFRSLVWHANEFTLSPLGERLLTRWGFRTFFVMIEEPRLGGGFVWDIEWKNGPGFEGRIGGDFSWCNSKTAKELAAERAALRAKHPWMACFGHIQADREPEDKEGTACNIFQFPARS